MLQKQVFLTITSSIAAFSGDVNSSGFDNLYLQL